MDISEGRAPYQMKVWIDSKIYSNKDYSYPRLACIIMKLINQWQGEHT